MSEGECEDNEVTLGEEKIGMDDIKGVKNYLKISSSILLSALPCALDPPVPPGP